MSAAGFIKAWKDRDGREIENAQSFLNGLCDLLDVPKPHDEADRLEYGFERPVTFRHANGSTSSGRIDLYKRGCFVLEAKQGSEQKARPADPRQHELITGETLGVGPKGMAYRNSPAWGAAMLKAHGQAYAYARALEPSEGWPPFLIVVDIGHVFHVYADFSGAGKNYAPFPDGTKYRIHMDDLADAEIRNRLKAIWNDPLSLDPTRTAARVTRQIAGELAELGKSFEGQGHAPDTTAKFLMRCLFTMFAEDVELIPKGAFTGLLAELRGHPQHVAPTLQSLWTSMNGGGFSSVLKRDVLHFNGGLFADADALPVNALQLGLLIRAAEHDWKQVEPAIFGTLMERALSPKARHRLGAHFTPRAYVERLVGPTILEPLRADWLDVQAAALKLHAEGKLDEAVDTMRAFKRSLCNIRVLDPACGSGNFLYVALEGMKRLEGEVSEALRALGDREVDAFTVDPHQFLGIEKNPWAAAVAELVLWIGYLQWHFRTFGKATPSQPVLKDFQNIECRDALLNLKGERPRVDENGKPVTRWDGESYSVHPVTGKEVPDLAAQTEVVDFDSAEPATWPEAEFILGNPPFIGKGERIREALGDGYVEALWTAYPDMPQSADFVMYWWHKAAKSAAKFDPKHGGVRRFGFITTNSLGQAFARRVMEPFVNDRRKPLSLVYAIPDHPWVDSKDGAKVRISMTVATSGRAEGKLFTIKKEAENENEAEGRQVEFSQSRGRIFPTLAIGTDVSAVVALEANKALASMGVILGGRGFILNKEAATARQIEAKYLRPIMSPSQLIDGAKGDLVLDLQEVTDEADLRSRAPHAYQYLRDEIFPQRASNNDPKLRTYWWKFRRSNEVYRSAIGGLRRYIATVETAKHRVFQFVPGSTLIEHGAIAIGTDDAAIFSVLSGRIHGHWAVTAGGTLEDRPRYNKTVCFDPFPFPVASPGQIRDLRALGEELDSHRKKRQAEHPKLTLTQMYNVLEKRRAGETLEGKDKIIYDQGLIGMLRDIHDRIDTAVADAYSWPADLSDAEILDRLVALNKQRKLEEAAGHIRWLRPDYQNPTGAKRAAATGELDVDEAEEEVGKHAWPKVLPAQVSIVRAVLSDLGEATAEQVARTFVKAPRKQVKAILESLAAIGQARTQDGERFAA